MKNIKKVALLSTLIISSFSFANTYLVASAAENSETEAQDSYKFEFVKAPTLSNEDSKSVEIVWEDVSGAEFYSVSYGKTSQASISSELINYDTTLDGFINKGDEKKSTIDGLTPGTKYYISVQAVDSEGNEIFSPELELTTKGDTASLLALEEVKVLSKNELELNFNSDLDQSESAVRDFRIVEGDNIKDLSVEKIVLETSNKLKLILSEEMKTNTEYKTVVISLTDKNGNNIEAGINGSATVTTPSSFVVKKEVTEDMNSAKEEAVAEPTPLVVEPTPTVVVEEAPTIKVEEVKAEVTKLPQTGPESMFIIMFTMLLAGAVVLKRKKA